MSVFLSCIFFVRLTREHTIAAIKSIVAATAHSGIVSWASISPTQTVCATALAFHQPLAVLVGLFGTTGAS